ncbi:MAG: hypothetical protein A3J51_01875 [Omnitrophica WOR_2 bacterium RIFCSPHIGHO2_02_FULL_45_21]|nr:MAG: hypothetical protein A3J51_01875 [Omnitrophica WOR_2 bacterium RIFCSPHIGHO2_02_FULL_45_21]
MPDEIIKIFVSIIGAVAGSFLNVCIFRMPSEGYSLVSPSSHCPLCKKPVLWHDNIPLLSFLFLKGRCRFCRQRISFQYPLVELLTACAFLIIYNRYLLSWDFLIYAIFACGLIIATFIDIRWRIIPDEISLGMTALGLIFALIKSLSSLKEFPQIAFIDSLFGAILGGALIYGSGVIGNLIFFKLMKKESIEGETESIGGGDVKLMMMMGSFLGWKLVVLTFFLAPFFGAVVGVYILIFKKSHLIPYGPFLSLAALISLFFGSEIIRFLFFR